MAIKAVAVGVVGCGNISETYFRNAALFPGIRIVACADLVPEAAAARAAQYGVSALSIDALLAEADIRIVLNLTPPAAHGAVGRAAIGAGKHLYGEKPLCGRFAEGRALLDLASHAGLRVACAPDTVFGAAHQAARTLIDDGAIGRVVAGHAAVLDRGMEAWHPNPAFFFAPGGGPVLDMGPYYLTSLVALLGPATHVMAQAATGFAQRTVGSGARQGERIEVTIPTTVQASIAFAGGAQVGFTASWDVWRHGLPHLELYGTEGSLRLPDPNWFGGPVVLSRRGEAWVEHATDMYALGVANHADGASRVADYRIVGLVDLAHAITEGRPPRADAALALHVLEIMEAIERSAAEGSQVVIATRAERPAPVAEADVQQWLEG